MTYSCEIWILEIGSDYRRGWLLVRGDHYAADAARLPSAARLVWAGESSLGEASKHVERLLEGKRDHDEDEDGPAVAAHRR